MTQPPDQWGGQWGAQPGGPPDPYQQGGYQQNPGQQGGFPPDPYQQSPGQQNPYQQNPYQQGGYQQNPYLPGGPYPLPGGRRRGLVIGLSAALVVLIVGAVVTILLVNKDDPKNAGGPQVPTTAAPYPSPIPPSNPTSVNPSTDQPTTDQTTTDQTTTTTTGTSTGTSTDEPTTTGTSTAVGDQKAVIAANQSFWAAVKAADYDKVADLTCRQYRSKLPDALERYLNGREKDLKVTIKGATITGTSARVQETVAFPGEKTDTAPWDMKFESGGWLVCDN
ncbi:hypothetical protein ABLG96_05265 [Nakamurella sp. A5-74]|uniref:DUF4878 domain-containing protein n=1 Tax=Nakamurella sp. A5-74 TaxID=3158264 RepID=A0AAU8DTL9_9ACTN